MRPYVITVRLCMYVYGVPDWVKPCHRLCDWVSPGQVLQIHTQTDGNDIRPHYAHICNERTSTDLNTLRTGSFKLFKRPFPGFFNNFNPLNAELNLICYLLALLAHYFLHVSRIRVKSLTLRLLMSYIYIYIYVYV